MAFYNLYPPVIDSYMPAFIVGREGSYGDGYYTGSVRVYFSLSKYNSIQDISAVWLSLVDTTTNFNVLQSKTSLEKFVKAPEGVSAGKGYFFKDTKRAGDDCYYIDISEEDIILSSWETGKYYKAQLRFETSEVKSVDNEMDKITTAQNNGVFSEWSTACLLYALTQPIVKLKDFSPTEDNQLNNEVVLPSSRDNVVAGKISFKKRLNERGVPMEEEEEELESYKLYFYKKDSDGGESLVFESEEVFTGVYNPNEINYQLFFGLEEGSRYKMKLVYTTKNLYVGTEVFSFLVLDLGGVGLDGATVVTAPYTELGCIGVTVTATERYLGNLTIRRTSNKSNFTLWEDVYHYQSRPSTPINFEWRDYYVESGVWYKYCVQKRDVRGSRGLSTESEKIEALFLEDMFISGRNNQHLRIQFNPQISSYSQVKLDSVTQTLGGKYPFIKRNADVGYKQFTISGLISHFMNADDCFTSMQGLREYVNPFSREDQYTNPYADMGINDYNDFALEKEFRSRVEEFLYDGEVKMFRSLPEGSMLVRLTNISLTPNQTLGRMIYSFSATVTEIDDWTFENIEKYKLYSRGELMKVEDVNLKTVQVSIDDFNTDTNLVTEIKIKEESQQENESYLKEVGKIDSLDIEFQSFPERIAFYSDGKIQVCANDLDEEEKALIDQILMGYIINVNNQQFYVPVKYKEDLVTGKNKPYGIFHLEGANLSIDSVTSGMEDASHKHSILATVKCFVATVEDILKVPVNVSITPRLGQLNTKFKPITSIGEIITSTCEKIDGNRYEKLFNITEVTIEAEPYSVVYIRTMASEANYRRFLIGPTGILKIRSSDYILDMYIKGLEYDCESFSLSEAGLNKWHKEIVSFGENNLYLETLLKGIKNKEKEGEYNVVKHNGVIYLYDIDDKVIIKPTFSFIDYHYQIEKGEYLNEV